MIFKKEKGSAILVTLLILGIVLVSALSIAFVNIQEFKASRGSSKTGTTYQLADEGVEAVMYEITKGGFNTVTQLSNCQSSGKIGGASFGYEVVLFDKDSNIIDCIDDGSSPISDIKKIKSVGTLVGKNQRSVDAFVPIACNDDTDDSYTKLLLHFDGGDDGATFVDATGDHPVSDYGDISITNEEKKFCKSGYFDGNGDYLSLSDSEDWNFENEDFTIDFWIYPEDVSSGTQTFFAQNDSSGYAPIRLDLSPSGSLNLHTAQSGPAWLFVNEEVAPAGTIENNSWYHLAVVRDEDKFKVFVNGTEKGNVENNGELWNSNNNFKVGALVATSPYLFYFKGYIDELRISKGVVRWTNDFTSPRYPY